LNFNLFLIKIYLQ